MTNEQFLNQFNYHPMGGGISAKIKTKSGVTLSVIAGEYYYSSPRRNVDPKLYNSFEVALLYESGFMKPSDAIPTLKKLDIDIGEYDYYFNNEEEDLEYMYDDEAFSTAVLSCVPKNKVLELIEHYNA